MNRDSPDCLYYFTNGDVWGTVGYSSLTLYYQKDNLAYPIEIQLWCGRDYLFNIWSHRHVYKYKNAGIGQKLYEEYKNNKILTEQDFLKQVEYWEGEMNGR